MYTVLSVLIKCGHYCDVTAFQRLGIVGVHCNLVIGLSNIVCVVEWIRDYIGSNNHTVFVHSIYRNLLNFHQQKFQFLNVQLAKISFLLTTV